MFGRRCKQCGRKSHVSCEQKRTHINGLQIFRDDNLEPALQEQINAAIADLETRLIDYLDGRCESPGSALIRYRILGETEASAKLWFVVLCPAPVVEHAESFFQQRLPQETLAQIDVPGGIKVAYVGKPLRFPSESWDDVLVALDEMIEQDEQDEQDEHEEHEELWSKAITLRQRTKVSRAIMGGMLVAKNAKDQKAIFGLTVGHLLHYEGASKAQDSDLDSTTESELATSPDDTIIGRLAEISFSEQARNLDWALIEFAEQDGHDLHDEQNKTVSLGNCSGIVKFLPELFPSLKIQISNLPARMVCPWGKSFVRVYPLYTTEVNDFELPKGKSGSWVVSEDGSNLSVHGMAVADDGFGDIYMIPLADIMDDIRQVWGVSSVSLPRDTNEILHLTAINSFSLDKDEPVSASLVAGASDAPPSLPTTLAESSKVHTTNPSPSPYLPKPDEKTVWFCSSCGDGPIGLWNKYCSNCGHVHCTDCTRETVSD